MVTTTPEYWDCECPERFIHKAAEASCPACGARRDESPDSRPDEIRPENMATRKEA